MVMSEVALLKESIRLARDCRQTVTVWGHRGIGKSQIIRQLATEGIGETIERNGKQIRLPMGIVDLRCSQLEASDIRGLPDKLNGRTVYTPPAEMPIGDRSAADIYEELETITDPAEYNDRMEKLQPHYKHGYLLLDELNRAQDDVLQAVFQLLLDKKVGQYVLPLGWSIVVACNFMKGDYITNGFNDAALLDRMCHLQFNAGEQTVGDWSTYMAKKHGEFASSAIEFCASNPDHMTGKVEGELGFIIQPSPRSWDAVVEVEKVVAAKGYSDQARFQVIQGLVGQTMALTYKEYSCPVKPRDIVAHGIEKYRKKLSELTRSELLSVCWGMVATTRGRLSEVPIINICLDLAEVLLSSPKIVDKDVIVGFLHALICEDEEKRQMTACITNRELAAALTQFFADENPFIVELTNRKELHKKISAVAWGTA